MIKCPGQDTRYWKPDDVYELECAKCGRLVEFFKTDPWRDCPGCGSRIANPKVTLGCAQWCDHAVACLGYDPKTVRLKKSADKSLADRLIDAVKVEFGSDRTRIDHALAVLEHAREILATEGGQPRVVIAAALLHDIGIREAEKKHGSSAGRWQEIEGPPIAKRILEEAGFDPVTIEHVCDIVASHHSAGKIDTLEFRIIWDADWLVNLPAVYGDRGREELGNIIHGTLKTEAGKTRAREQFLGLSTSRQAPLREARHHE